ncbi:hypothetical protein PHMEG_0005277 [Phytophthora megakarya]|uniref:DUF1697 domain-containing protein n=1 Tax=Phytophthora megakarya TaxID=4795 RepID=A0A225WTB5_9STRA|nr:hypothetical protein PHMEG_0005277 [Phytophthora megakarya]
MVANAKRKASAKVSSSPKAKRITRSSAVAVETNATEDIRPPAHATDGASDSQDKICSSSIKVVAFLRGVNIGGRTHSMKSIAEALGKAGFSNVATFLASGNVIFDAPTTSSDGTNSSMLAIEHRVEDTLEKLFGHHIAVFVRSMDEVTQLGEQVVKTATAVNVVLVKEELNKEQRKLVEALSTHDDTLEHLDKAFVWYSSTKMSESPLFKVAFDKKLNLPVTVRTVNTLRRIVKKFG